MPVVKVPTIIANEGLKRAGGQFQEEKYGKDMRVCTISRNSDGKITYRDTVTGKEFTK